MDRVMVSFRVDKDTYKKLKRLAKKLGRSMTYILEHLVNDKYHQMLSGDEWVGTENGWSGWRLSRSNKTKKLRLISPDGELFSPKEILKEEEK